GIVTNNFTAEQWGKLRVCGLDSLIDFMVTAESAGVAKPHPEIFRVALDQGGVGPSESVMVGDSWEVDVIGAVHVGLPAVWFDRWGSTTDHNHVDTSARLRAGANVPAGGIKVVRLHTFE